MYKYDIRLPNKEQLSLHIKYEADNLLSAPINISKRLSYLKNKINSHRNISNINEPAIYVVLNYKNEEIFTQHFAPGEKGRTSQLHFKEKSKPLVRYKTVYLYKGSNILTDTLKENEIPLTSYEVICDEDGKIITDLTFLKYLSDYIYYNRTPLGSYRKLLVQIATYFPTTKEEFIHLSGAGEKVYEIIGKDFVELIRDLYPSR